MCGIFAVINRNNMNRQCIMDEIRREFQKGKNRGPENSQLKTYKNNVVLGFHRLAINGLDDISNQPMTIDGVTLICNGEIYNYKELFQTMDITPTTHSDCEVIIHLYLRFGIEQTLNMLDGVFAFVLYDANQNTVHISRDPLGVRPLYWNGLTDKLDTCDNSFYVASELKCITNIANMSYHFPPGKYTTLSYDDRLKWVWRKEDSLKTYFTLPLPNFRSVVFHDEYTSILHRINVLLRDAVRKRCLTTERPVACLLSGGVDSSLIASLVAKYFYPVRIETFSIGLQGSKDLLFARKVAEHINSIHHEIIITKEEAFQSIPTIIYAIESYDVTSIRASIFNHRVGLEIKENSNAKVIFNGDGSDELFGGYIYLHLCPNDIEFDKNNRQLLLNIHETDVNRSDKCISAHGLEPRTPFLDRSLVQYVMSLSPFLRNHNNGKNMEKYLLRNAFASDNLLPEEVLWRRKEAFSDGVCSQDNCIKDILQTQLYEFYKSYANVMEDGNAKKLLKRENEPNFLYELEKQHYRQLFDKHFKRSDILKEQWMPKYTDATDPSARTLDIYQQICA